MLSLILGGKDSRDHWLGDITSQFLNNDGIKIGWQRYHLHGFLGIFSTPLMVIIYSMIFENTVSTMAFCL